MDEGGVERKIGGGVKSPADVVDEFAASAASAASAGDDDGAAAKAKPSDPCRAYRCVVLSRETEDLQAGN